MACGDETLEESFLFPEQPGNRQPQIRNLAPIYIFPIRFQDFHGSL
jgi:hypothetical protein